MRKALVGGLLLSALIIACETKAPVGPGSVTVTQTTTSTTVPTTTTSTTALTTTTTTVSGGIARAYAAFQPPPDIPANMTLFFELIFGTSPVRSVLASLPLVGQNFAGATENKYKVTGVYVMGNGTSGAVNGQLGGSENPLETGGDFTGTLTAKTVSGCTAERSFAGRLTSQTLQWAGGGTLSNTCAQNPLGFSGLTMLRSDSAPPLPTTTIGPSTTSTSTTVCGFTLSPPSGSIGATGGTIAVTINTGTGCSWATHSFETWMTISPVGGTGPGSVTVTVAPTQVARQGRLLIASNEFIVTQAGPVATTTTTTIMPLVDLAPTTTSTPGTPPQFCRFSQTGELLVTVSNFGKTDAPASLTRVTFTISTKPVPTEMMTPVIPAGMSTDLNFPFPAGCLTQQPPGTGCPFTILVNADGAVMETTQANNSATGTCFPGVPIRSPESRGVASE
jgi:hypothetical protein